MKPLTVMFIAGEASGDLLAAELAGPLREALLPRPLPTPDTQPLLASLEPRFFGAGGPRMAAAGVDLAFDLTAHSVIGLAEVLRRFLTFRRLFHSLRQLALSRLPDAIVCIDYSGFNRRFAQAIKRHTRARTGWFHGWNPRIVQYVSPQVWASRERRVYQVARDFDLLLSIFPFEKEWYAARVPGFPVEFIGHPIIDRYALANRARKGEPHLDQGTPLVLLLPGSRTAELRRHLPVMIGALALLRASMPQLRARMVLPHESLVQQAKAAGLPPHLQVQTGPLPESLAQADLAIASTGTVTMECAVLGVPTVALYKASWSTYQIGKRIINVKHLAMPNLLAGETLYPEFVQHDATPQNLASAGLDLLADRPRRERIRNRLKEIVRSLGPPGANRRAAQAIARLLRAGAA